MKKKMLFVNETDHEVEHNGYIYPSKNYNPGLSSYHAETKRYTLCREGFPDIKLRYILGEWEMLSHVYGNGDERWSKVEFSEEVIQNHIQDYNVCDDCDVINNPSCNNCVGS